MKLHWTALNLNEINQNNLSLDLAIKSIDFLDKHIEILNEQRNVTSDAIDKTLSEGDSLLSYLKEISSTKLNESNSNLNNDPNATQSTININSNGKQTQYSNSYLHLEGKFYAMHKNTYDRLLYFYNNYIK